MELKTHVDIQAPAEAIWSIITDIDHAQDHISGILKIEILNRPVSGLIGLKWRETRVMFGKEATEVMWITEALENVSYATRAESHGAVYISNFLIEPKGKGCSLTMGFRAEVENPIAKFMNLVFGPMMKKSTLKAVIQDLEDIKAAAEAVK